MSYDIKSLAPSYSPGVGFIKVDLRYLQSLKITYEEKKAIAQSIGKKKLFEKYAKRERNRERDFINKLVKQITTLLPNAVHVVEDLEKRDMVARGRTSKERRKRNARTPWETIHRKLSEKAKLIAEGVVRNSSNPLKIEVKNSSLQAKVSQRTKGTGTLG